MDIRQSVSEEDTRHLLETIIEDVEAPSPNDAPRAWPAAQRHTIDHNRDALLADAINTSEIMVIDFYRKGHLSQRTGQMLLDMTRHPHFDPKEIRSDTIIHLLRRLERPFAETAMHTYDLWQEGDGNQRLEFVVRDYLEVFREIMQSPQWKDQFDLTFRAIFDAEGGRLIGPPSSAMWWERIQKKLPPGAAVGVTQLYFDETFQKQNQGIDTGSMASMNLGLGARYQPGSIQMFCLLPTYKKDAAAGAGLNQEQIKKREMEIHQACIGIWVRDMNKYSSLGSEVNVQCSDGKVYSMLILLMCLAMDQEATEKHCLKAHNGCLSCGCRWEDYADSSGTLSWQPILVEDTIRKIEAASAQFFAADGSIPHGNHKKIDEWEKEHKIKLRWNNWFDVSLSPLFHFLRLDSASRL
jgi:hypothetical protein